MWNDGRAEVAFYDSETEDDKVPRIFKEQIIIKKEGDALKMNVVHKFDTQNYPISYLTSIYSKQEDLITPIKVTVGSQDWVGNVIKIYKEGVLQIFSDHEPAGDQTIPLLWNKGDMFEDQLPLALRAILFQQDFQFETRIWTLLTNNLVIKPEPVETNIKVVGEEVVRTRMGSWPCWIVKVTKNGSDDTYWFEKKEPHILTKMVTADGRKRTLTGRARWGYWDLRIPKPNILN